MYIMTDFDLNQDLVCVLDTTDGSNDTVRLSSLAQQVLVGALRVKGVGVWNDGGMCHDDVPLPAYNIYLSPRDAQIAYTRSVSRCC